MEEKRKHEIQKEARNILEKFGKELGRVPNAKAKEEKSESYRDERGGNVSNGDFKKRIFKNAPNKDDNYMLAEKAGW